MRLMAAAVSLMFTIISLHKQRGRRRPESLQHAGRERWGRERGRERGRGRQREGERGREREMSLKKD